MTDELIFNAPPISVYQTEDGWVYSKFEGMEGEAKGRTVAVVPFFLDHDDNAFILTHYQPVPAWGEGLFPTAITGAVNPDEGLAEAAVRELAEETGFSVTHHAMIRMGRFKQGKASATDVTLFIVKLYSKKSQTSPKGDGSSWEGMAKQEWVAIEKYMFNEDFKDIVKCMPLAMAANYIYHVYHGS